MYTVSFTGYRPEKLGFFGKDDPMFVDFMTRLRGRITSLAEDGVETFISGMALGSDTYCAEIVLELKQKYPKIRLVAAVPCANQSERWSREQQRHYSELLEKCDERVVLAESYFKGCMQNRNRYLVDNCDILLAVYDGKPGGTKSTVDYAKRKGRKIIYVSPM